MTSKAARASLCSLLGGALLCVTAWTSSVPAHGDVASAVVIAPAGTNPNVVNSLAYSSILPGIGMSTGWTGSVAGCNPGTISAAASAQALTSINAYRQIEGLDPVALDPNQSAADQAAALISKASGTLNHTPSTSAPCYSDQGYDGSSHSNLSNCAGELLALKCYMDDYGASNTEAGHRRWLLDPYLNTMGYGATDVSDAVYVVSGDVSSNHTTPEWIPWPAAGYFPTFLNPVITAGTARWMLASPVAQTSFDTAQATVQNAAGQTLPITAYQPAGGYGDMTALVFDVSGLPDPKTVTAPTTYHVTVTGITRGSSTLDPVTYDVTLLPFLARQMAAAAVISGERVAGHRLTVTPPTWSPAGPTLSFYQWFRDGAPIRDLNGDSYIPMKADVGHTLSVQITTGDDGQSPYLPIAPVVITASLITDGQLHALSKVKIRHDHAHPKYLRAYGPTFNLKTKRPTYIWTRNGKRIARSKSHLLLVTGRYTSGVFKVTVIAQAKGHGKVTVKSKKFRLH